MNKLYNYKNGNVEVDIFDDGTRILNYDKEMKLEYPLNMDIRVSTKCAFGQKPDGSYVLCDFCHESAKTDGYECDYESLKLKLYNLPKGIELAIGCNELTSGLIDFLHWGKNQGYICNLTINQGHLKRDENKLIYCFNHEIVYGLGISYRPSLSFSIPKSVLEYKNTVFHVIAGIDKVEDVLELKDKGVRKLLILGEKDFGFNKDHVFMEDINPWIWKSPLFLNRFEVVSFDNLALEQLKVRRLFLDQETFHTFNQGEYSFYIDAAQGFMAPSSRSGLRVPFDKYSIKEYFSKLMKTQEMAMIN